MENKELIDYISTHLAHGVNEEEIKKALLTAGWAQTQIEENFLAAKTGASRMVVGIPESKTTSRVKIIAGSTVALLLLAGVALATYNYVAPSPQKVLLQASAKIQSIKSFDYNGRITGNVTSQTSLFSLLNPTANTDNRVAGASNTKVTLDMSGTVDASDTAHPKSDMNFVVTADPFSVNFNMRSIDNILYLKMDQIPELIQGLNKYSGVWIKVDPEELSKQYGVSMMQKTPNLDLTDNQKKQLEDLAVKSNIFSKMTKLPNDSIDGSAMYHYGLTLDKSALVNYINQANKILGAASMSPITLQELDGVNLNNIEVWIGKSDHLFHRFSADMKVAQSSSTPTSGSLNIVFNMKNFNHTVSIAAPIDAKNIQDIIKEFLTPQQPTK